MGEETSSTISPSTSTSSTTTTQPPGTEPGAVEPIIVDLLARLDEITNEIMADPSVVLDPDARILAAFNEVHAPGDAYDARLETYRDNAERGATAEPLNDDEPISATTLVGDLSTLDRNTVEGRLCTVYNFRATSAEGGELRDGLAHPGRVTAVRLEGLWKIQQIDEDGGQICDPGAAA
jgi:hypothetical protein